MTDGTTTGAPVVSDSTTLNVAAIDDTQSANVSSGTGQAGGKVEEGLHLRPVALVGLLRTRRVRAAALGEAEALEVVADHDLALAEDLDALLGVGGVAGGGVDERGDRSRRRS